MSRLRVFVVDPDAQRASILARAVEARGHQAWLFEHGERAIDQFVQEPADAIFVEYALAGRDGVATVEAIRWAPGGRDVRVVLLAHEEPMAAPLQMLALRVDALDALVGPLEASVVSGLIMQLEAAAVADGTLALGDASYALQMSEARPEAPRPLDSDWSDSTTVVVGIARAASPIVDAETDTFAEEATAVGLNVPAVRVASDEESHDLGGEPTRAALFDDQTITEPGQSAGANVTTSARALSANDARALLGLTPLGTRTPEPVTAEPVGVEPRTAPKRSTPTPFRAVGATPASSPEASRPSSVLPPRFASKGSVFKAPARAPARPATPDAQPPSESVQIATDIRRIAAPMRPVDPATADEGRSVVADAAIAGDGWAGALETTPFPVVLHRLAEARATGGLVCTSAPFASRPTVDAEPPTKIVYFRGGVPVHVRSNLVDECLGQLLLRTKRIGHATLDESVRRMERDGRRQGEVLVEMGALAPRDVDDALAEQVRQKLFDLFGWRRGALRFSAALQPPRDVVPLRMALSDIVFEGICAATPATQLLDLMTPRLGEFVVPVAGRIDRFARVRLPADLRDAIERIDGTRALRDVLRSGARPGAIAQLLYALECLDAVRYAHAAQRAAPLEMVPLSVSAERSVDDIDLQDAEPRSAERVRSNAAPQARATHEDEGEWDDVTAPLARSARAERAPETAPAVRIAPVHSVGAVGSVDVRQVQVEAQRVAPFVDDASVTAPRAPVANSVDVDRMFEAERCFRRGNRALERGAMAEALESFGRAVELCPDEGEFVAYLGWAKHSSAPSSVPSTRDALALLERAAVLAPDLHVTHLLLARVAEHAGLRRQAWTEYRRVLELEPSSEARAALERLERLGAGE